MTTRLSVLFLALALTANARVQAQTQPSPRDYPIPPATQPVAVPESPTPAPPGAAAPHTPDCAPCPTADTRCRFWGGAEYLLWWVQGQRIPALVTTSPAGTPISQAGVLGVPGTGILFGNTRVTNGPASGVRLTAGGWLDDCRTCGIGAEFFILQNLGDGFAARSPGTPILARPFFNTRTGAQDAQIIAFPGLAVGSVSSTTDSQLLGAGAYMRHVLCQSCDPCGGCGYAVECIAGYRYLNLDEHAAIGEQVQSVSTARGAPPVGTLFNVTDTYSAQTQFHGGDIGLAGRLTWGRCSLMGLAKLGIGANVRDVDVGGNTQVLVPGQPPAYFNGGLLTAGRTGHVGDSVFALVPEFRLGVGYQVTSCVRVTAGYNLLWWTNVARAGNQINTSVDPNLLPPALMAAATRPLSIQGSTLWVHGLNVGLIFDY